MKKILAIALTLAMVLTMTACGASSLPVKLHRMESLLLVSASWFPMWPWTRLLRASLTV